MDQLHDQGAHCLATSNTKDPWKDCHRIQNQALRRGRETRINSWGLYQGPSAETMARGGARHLSLSASRHRARGRHETSTIKAQYTCVCLCFYSKAYLVRHVKYEIRDVHGALYHGQFTLELTYQARTRLSM